MKDERDAILHALALMYNQYCSNTGHEFMVAGEIASEVLEKFGLLKADEAGRGEIDYDVIDKLPHPYETHFTKLGRLNTRGG